jgi:ABC-type multidrug transport system fused ATPase/permease subunit
VDREKELRRAGWRLVGSASRLHWGWIATSFTAALAWTATKVTIPLLAGAAIDQGIVDHDTGALLLYVGLMIAVGAFQAVVSSGFTSRSTTRPRPASSWPGPTPTSRWCASG